MLVYRYCIIVRLIHDQYLDIIELSVSTQQLLHVDLQLKALFYTLDFHLEMYSRGSYYNEWSDGIKLCAKNV